ncbi:aa3-type cytochrome oxidase subunit CtaJ [Mycolicibacterium confluentis]|uniref:Uncharacterized protein n=1 Tax=Mycolicibacterium confluentis TaxID=28047 RepID=A0A7I7XTX5_9MYCO|nr:hypothetical protein [Mycolicibacterium confluentis]MCV7320902.1 hypothetical protein [Mycolicibacterium confluentis]ORV27056.1 hypothetical protein AWB99_20015 [Mycolicibacterium confluentis]BBZ32695.1 hypothetical protein MCNF_13000 [Mycolicibacterium confluentis]
MSTALTHSLLGGVPLLLAAILALLTLPRKGPHPASYNLPDEWTYGPILWAATDEKIGDAHGHGADELTVGGGASGKW